MAPLAFSRFSFAQKIFKLLRRFLSRRRKTVFPFDRISIIRNHHQISLHQTLSRQMTSSSTPAAVVDKTAEQLATVQLDQDGKPLTKNALKKLEKEREKAKKKVGPLRGNYRNVSL